MVKYIQVYNFYQTLKKFWVFHVWFFHVPGLCEETFPVWIALCLSGNHWTTGLQCYCRPFKSKFFCADWILKIKFCAETCTENAIKTCKLKKKIRLWQIFTTFAFKSQSFAQILKNFAQVCVCTSAAFRSSDLRSIIKMCA